MCGHLSSGSAARSARFPGRATEKLHSGAARCHDPRRPSRPIDGTNPLTNPSSPSTAGASSSASFSPQNATRRAIAERALGDVPMTMGDDPMRTSTRSAHTSRPRPWSAFSDLRGCDPGRPLDARQQPRSIQRCGFRKAWHGLLGFRTEEQLQSERDSRKSRQESNILVRIAPLCRCVEYGTEAPRDPCQPDPCRPDPSRPDQWRGPRCSGRT